MQIVARYQLETLHYASKARAYLPRLTLAVLLVVVDESEPSFLAIHALSHAINSDMEELDPAVSPDDELSSVLVVFAALDVSLPLDNELLTESKPLSTELMADGRALLEGIAVATGATIET